MVREQTCTMQTYVAEGFLAVEATIRMARVVGLKRIWDQKLSSSLMLVPFMTVHLLQFRFADTEHYPHPSWLITLTFLHETGAAELALFRYWKETTANKNDVHF